MKKIFFAVVALVAMISCSKNYTIDYNKQAIAFGDVFVDNATRADYSDGLHLTRFLVYGAVTGVGGTTNIFGGDEVIGEVGGNWNYVDSDTKVQYWVPGADYDFAAVADGTALIWSDEKDENGMPLLLHTYTNQDTNLDDMLYATAHVEDATANQGPVNFTFNHLLSKVHFTVTSTAEGDYYHTVTGIKVANYSSGTYAITTDTWTGKTAKDVPFADIAEVTNTAGKSNADMLLVPTAATFNVMFTVNLYRDNLYKDDTLLSTENKTVPVTIKDGEQVVGLQKGHAYNFTIACSVGNPIQFTVNSDPTWDTTNGNVNVQ